MSLRWRITGATVLVVVLTVAASVSVGYYATQSRLNVLVDRIGDDEAAQLARNLSREYTAAAGWTTVGQTLSEAGYVYDVSREGEGHEEGKEESSEIFHQDRIRVVVTGMDGRVVTDNLSELSPGTEAPDLSGRRETVFDLADNRPVGHVYVDVNHEFLSTESHGFLNTLLYIVLIGGLLTVGIAVLLAAWLFKRIMAPVTALTEATQAIAQGDTARLPVTSSDELGQMSTSFNKMTSALEAQRELRRRLVNDVSHELNTPLSVILLEAKGLRDGLQSPDNASDHIIQEVDRLRGLATDLDWLAETDLGELRLTIQRESSISEFLSAEVARWRPQAQARQVEMSLHVPDDLSDLRVDIDRMRMGRALGNVISNAVRCTDAGGNIAITAGLESGDTLVIWVADDGIGIDPANLPHVFDRFYRTDESQSRGIGGTGLGLAIAQAVVEGHGGTITAASDGLGQGVTVTIRLSLIE